MLNLDTSFTKAFANSSHDYFSATTSSSSSAKDKKKHKAVGKVRSAGPGAGNYTFVSLYEAGHMVRRTPPLNACPNRASDVLRGQVPHDQPAVALELLDRWLANEPLV